MRRLVVTGMWAAVAVLGAGCSSSETGGAPGASVRDGSTGSGARSGVGGSGPYGEALVRGTVRFTGKPLEMKVPKLRAGSDVCKRTKTPHNAVVVEDGKLKDVLVRIGAGSVAGVWKTPETRAEVRQSDCMYVPRIQGVMAGQGVVISNEDSTLHNQHVVRGYEVVAGRAQPKGAAPFELEVTEEPGIYRFSCDIHPWMRAFVVVTDHPFFAVSGEDGGFRIERVPAGRYEVEAWHSHYGRLEKRGVEVGAAGEVIVDFEYDEAMGEPEENKGELVGQW